MIIELSNFILGAPVPGQVPANPYLPYPVQPYGGIVDVNLLLLLSCDY